MSNKTASEFRVCKSSFSFRQTLFIHSFIHPRETPHIHIGSNKELCDSEKGTLSNLLQIRPPHLRRIIFPITTLVSTKSNIHDDCQITENEPRTNLTSQSNVLLNPLFVKLMMILQSIKIISPLEFFVYHLMSTCTFTPKARIARRSVNIQIWGKRETNPLKTQNLWRFPSLCDTATTYDNLLTNSTCEPAATVHPNQISTPTPQKLHTRVEDELSGCCLSVVDGLTLAKAKY